ncbi:MAG: XdhC family protein [Coriobacteriales bacterium]|jgi:xanthine dehydrogenase accessory factor|nr:XdhC family protein [Coriobacteriales bacterium]
MGSENIYSRLLEILQRQGLVSLVSEYSTDGTVLRHLVSPDDEVAWTKLRQRKTLPQAITDGPVTSIHAADGTLTLIEDYAARPRLLILGAGHIAFALARMAALTDFEVLVYDDRPSFANPARFPDAQVICDSFAVLFEHIQLRSSDFVVIVTRGHKHDKDCLQGVLAGSQPAYTGMIGSRRRVAIVLDQLRQAGFDAARIERVHSPIGLRIAAVTPAEISVSILAEMIAVRRGGDAAGGVSENSARSGAVQSCDLEVVRALAGGAMAEALVTILRTDGSVPIETGAKLAMTYDGQLIGTIGGGCSEADAMRVGRDVIRSGGWRLYSVDMTADGFDEEGMVCGGEMQVVIEAIGREP